MEKAVLKTLIYSDIFDYPLTLREIHKWLIQKKSTLTQLEKIIKKLSYELRIMNYGKYYFLTNRNKTIKKRSQNEKQSKKYFKKIKIISQILKIIPWIKLVGISGGLSMDNAGRSDDIDLFVITAKNRMWICRILALGILELLGQRRKVIHSIKQAAGKICLNILVEEDKLEQSKKNLYTAHEVLQLKPLWFRDGIYSKYLEVNNWVFKFLPNWISDMSSSRMRGSKEIHGSPIMSGMTDYVELLSKKFQLKIMQKPKGRERIEDGALYFHPKDYGSEIMLKYLAGVDKVC